MSLSTIGLTLGPIQIGYSITTSFFGLLTIQTFIYFQNFERDLILNQILVAVVWLVGLGHQICASHVIYSFLIISFGDLDIPAKRQPLSLDLIIMLSALTSLLVQTFFVHRFWRATRKNLISCFFAILVAARFALSSLLGAKAFHTSSLLEFLILSKWLMTIVWVLGAIQDILVTIALCYDLRLQGRSAVKRTARLIDRIIVWCVATGMLTSTLSFVMAICFLALPATNFIWIAIYIPISPFSAISMVVSLHVRDNIRRLRQAQCLAMGSTITSYTRRTTHGSPMVAGSVGTTFAQDQLELGEGFLEVGKAI